MQTRAILVISSILFFGGCIGLAVVRLTNPFFKGLDWLCGAFAAGSIAAILFSLRPDVSSGLVVIIPNTLILLAYVFLQAGILELTESPSRVPRLGIFLLAAQAAVYPFFRSFPNVEQLCVITLGLSLAAQTIQSAVVLKRHATGGMRPPAWFGVILLANFAAYNLFRSAVVLTLGTTQNPQLPNPLETTTAYVFLGTGLGLGFGVFWMASTQIRIALEGLANSDPLTGIYNRRWFISLCEKELSRSQRTSECFSLLMFDLDHFKQVNDLYGHDAGDAVLCGVVARLRNAVRNIDTVGRWGGEEFVALLPNADFDAAMVVAHRLRRSIESLSVPHPKTAKAIESKPLSVTASIGVVTYFGQRTTIADLLCQCDAAMYEAKTQGRNRIVPGGLEYALQG